LQQEEGVGPKSVIGVIKQYDNQFVDGKDHADAAQARVVDDMEPVVEFQGHDVTLSVSQVDQSALISPNFSSIDPVNNQNVTSIPEATKNTEQEKIEDPFNEIKLEELEALM